MTRRHGMVLVEVIVALAVATVALVVLMGNFSSNKRLAMATRHRTAAILLSSNLMEQLEAHPFGLPAPAEWPGDAPPPALLERASGPSVVKIAAHPEQMLFYQQLTFKNGSAIGLGTADNDAVTLKVYWYERGAQRVLSSTMLLRRMP